MNDWPKCYGLRRWEDETVVILLVKVTLFLRRKKNTNSWILFSILLIPSESILSRNKRFLYFSTPLGKNNWDAVLLLTGQFSCCKPYHSQGPAERGTCQNSCPICSAMVGDVSEPSSTFCCLWSCWLPPKVQPAFTPLPHAWDKLNQFRVGSIYWPDKNLLTKNNIVSVVEGAGQEDRFSWRRLSVV